MSSNRATAAERRRLNRARRAELQFARALTRLAKKCGELARETFDPEKPLGSAMRLRAALERYGQSLGPWARATASRMVLDVARRDAQYWADKSKTISRNLRKEINDTPVGIAIREKTAEAAELISSLPLEAAERVEKMAMEYLISGRRVKKLSQDILATGRVTQSRARTIARTETSRAAGTIQQVRAESVGSAGYIWRTSEDIDVRDRHKRLAGRYFPWSSPPIAGENGERAHPGGIYNCRCWAEIVLPGEDTRNRSRFRAEAVA